jgi:hypothetical protein
MPAYAVCSEQHTPTPFPTSPLERERQDTNQLQVMRADTNF